MKSILLILWLIVPAFIAAYHYGPGQDALKRDDSARHVSEARKAVAAEDWAAAVDAYDAALANLPESEIDAGRRIRLARAHARLFNSELPTAHDELRDLLAELDKDQSPDQALVEQTRAALANAKYYLTWLMRLEGLPRDAWEPEIEAARQHLRLLAEGAAATGRKETLVTYQKDLESAVKLARMDLEELQGLPLPSQ